MPNCICVMTILDYLKATRTIRNILIGFDSLVRSATTEPWKYARNGHRKQKYRVENETTTQRLTWKTHNGGKNHDNPQAVEYTIREEYNVEENTQATTSCPLLHHTRRRLQDGGNNLSLSLSLCYTLYTTFLQQPSTT